MLMALLRGKLSREQENMEDILTSNVFGMLKYLPPEIGLLPFLAKGETIEEDRPLAQLANSASGSMAAYCFWPRLEEAGCRFCEPDVLLRVDGQAGKHLVLVEAKYRSGKSSFADDSGSGDCTTGSGEPLNARPTLVPGQRDEPSKDQLAKEWCNLASLARREGPNCKPWLVYLTADFGCPRESLDESFSPTRDADIRKSVLWLSWRHLWRIVSNKGESEICRDLAAMLKRVDLTFYEGISVPDYEPPLAWSFAAGSP